MGGAADGRRGDVVCQHLVIIYACVCMCVCRCALVCVCLFTRQQVNDKSERKKDGIKDVQWCRVFGVCGSERECVFLRCVGVGVGVWFFTQVTGGAETAEMH